MSRPAPSHVPDTASSLERVGENYVGRFTAMASPCEVLVDTDDREKAETALRVAREEALRIEAKFSRYRRDNLIHRINQAEGASVSVDEETAGLLDYAATCHQLSEGRFDITSGVLRRVWTFDGSDRVPTPEAITDALRLVGWNRVTWRNRTLTMPAGMILNVLLKNLFERGRPVFDHPLVALATYSFPSGHAAYSTMLYGLLAVAGGQD